MRFYRKHFGKVLLLSIWTALLGVGFWQLFIYANTPGRPAIAQSRWPAEAHLERDSNFSTLVIFGHPQCPCSKASVGELERLIPHIQGKVKSYVVFVKPKSQSDAWAKEDLWIKAQAIPDVQTVLDIDGVEASHFGAKTSGQTFLYDKNGNLVFHGGITPERGHMGDSNGRSAILQFVATGDIQISSTPVFGCSLAKPERVLAGEDNK